MEYLKDRYYWSLKDKNEIIKTYSLNDLCTEFELYGWNYGWLEAKETILELKKGMISKKAALDAYLEFWLEKHIEIIYKNELISKRHNKAVNALSSKDRNLINLKFGKKYRTNKDLANILRISNDEVHYLLKLVYKKINIIKSENRSLELPFGEYRFHKIQNCPNCGAKKSIRICLWGKSFSEATENMLLTNKEYYALCNAYDSGGCLIMGTTIDKHYILNSYSKDYVLSQIIYVGRKKGSKSKELEIANLLRKEIISKETAIDSYLEIRQKEKINKKEDWFDDEWLDITNFHSAKWACNKCKYKIYHFPDKIKETTSQLNPMLPFGGKIYLKKSKVRI